MRVNNNSPLIWSTDSVTSTKLRVLCALFHLLLTTLLGTTITSILNVRLFDALSCLYAL